MKPFDKALEYLQRKEEAEKLRLEEEARKNRELEKAIADVPALLERFKQEDIRVGEYLAKAKELKGGGIDLEWNPVMTETLNEVIIENPQSFPGQTQKPQRPIPNKCIELAVAKATKIEHSTFDQQNIEREVDYYICLFTTSNGTRLAVFEYEFKQLGHVWTERDFASGGETLKRLVNPVTTLEVLFEHRKP